MHPPNTMSFEPGLERGVPWGRDLFTFVTSAAGHMMRTLQRPRKNKPSKRQVNHRRFLHNMIQRKFSEIEAANQQLASSLFSADTSHNHSELKSSDKNEVKNRKPATMTSCETKTPMKQDEGNDKKILNSVVVNPEISILKSKAVTHPNSGEGNQSWEGVEEFEPSQKDLPQQTTDFSYERELIQSASADLDNLSQVTNILLEDSVFSWLESIERIRQSSDSDGTKYNDLEQEYLGITLLDMLPTSPAVSALSLDSCDFEEQMQPKTDHSSKVQHISESLQMDVMENQEVLDSPEGHLQSQYKDQRDLASVWHLQNEDAQSFVQDTITFNTPHEEYVMDDLTDCGSRVTTGGLEIEPQTSVLLESSLRDAEYDFRGFVASTYTPCRSSCHQNQTRYAARETGLTKDYYVDQPETDDNMTISKEGQYSGSCSWSLSEKSQKGLKQGNILNHSLDNQVLPRAEHVHPNQTITKYWEQGHVHKDHIPCSVTDSFYVLIDAEKNIVQTEATIHPHSVSSSTTQCNGFDVPTHANSNCRGDSCLYFNSEGDWSNPSFEGVAQSFPAPVYKPHPHPVSTPPLNDDWLFSNIVTEEDFNSIVISPEYAYC